MKALPPFTLARLALGVAATAAAASFMAPAFAEDIDIYGPQAAAGSSNLLLLLDNTSNWSANNQAWSRSSVYNKCLASSGMTAATCTSLVNSVFGADTSLKQGQVQLRALKYVLNDMVCNATSTLRVNVGLAMIGDSGTVRSNGDSNGFIRFAVQPLTGTATSAGTSCQRLIASLDQIDANITAPQFKAPSNADYSAAMYEVFKYFGGWSNPTLANSNPTNPPAGTPMGAQGYGPVRFSKALSIEDAAAFTDAAKTTYRSPLGTTGACDNNILAIVGNTYPNAEANAGPTRFQGINYSPAALTGATADTSRLSDEWAYFLRNGDISSLPGQQFITTTTINTYNAQENTSQTRLMKSMASVGGGDYYVVDGDLVKLKESFERIIARAAAVNSVFTATTLPVSTTTQGAYLNQLFIGMFRPDAERAPRWVGNLKQYQLGLDDLGEIRVLDANGQRALVGGTGFFSPTAQSYWSHSSVYFAQMPNGTPPTASDLPDGPTVEKGGAAQMLREANLQNATNRRVFTLPASGAVNGTALSTVPFTASNSAVAQAFSASQLAWIRGENNITDTTHAGYETPGSTTNANGEVVTLPTTGARRSIHGDVLHSRPVALNYGNEDVVVYYGANDGMLRAVDGRKSGGTAGQELWSFVAPEHYPMLARLHANTPALHLPATTSTGAEADKVNDADQKKSYAMDGPIGVFARYSTSSTIQEAIIYTTMRRGGSAVYAFDVTSKTEPRLKFKISPTGDYARLGQTWSMPRPVIFPAAAGAAFEDPIVFMGGGYDPAEDTNTSSGVGNVVYIINGRTGARLAALSTDYSVPGDVSVVDSNRDGIYDRAYVADVRGNLYRISMTNSAGTLQAPGAWTIRKIARLEGKVFGAPDVVATRDFIAVMVGTGDREKPLLATTSDNFFVIKDTTLTQEDRGGTLSRSDLSLVGEVSNSTYTLQAVAPDLNVRNGCYIRLSTQGEKVVNSPFTIAGITYFGTNRPTANNEHTCTANLGQARAYQFSLFCGLATSTVLTGGGMPPSPVGGFVVVTAGNTRQLMPFIIGGGGTSRATSGGPASSAEGNSHEAQTPPGSVTPVRKRQYYRIHNNNR